MSSSRGEAVTTYVPPEIKRKLEAWAKKEQRSISFLVAQLIVNAVKEEDSKTKTEKD
jgi:predicted transcriptional regulator